MEREKEKNEEERRPGNRPSTPYHESLLTRLPSKLGGNIPKRSRLRVFAEASPERIILRYYMEKCGLFHSALGGYFPEPDFWQAERSPHFPENVMTSGITMPPVHAIAAWRVFKNASNESLARSWLKSMYPKLFALHEYLYRDRDPGKEGLVYIRHPWESGLDNAPMWDLPLRSITIDKSSLPRYERRDLKKGIPRSQRPSDEDYDRYVYLVDLFRQLKYDEKAKSVRHDIIELARTWGFHEYFDPYKGTGYGTDNFSWTAALFIDAAMEELES